MTELAPELLIKDLEGLWVGNLKDKEFLSNK